MSKSRLRSVWRHSEVRTHYSPRYAASRCKPRYFRATSLGFRFGLDFVVFALVLALALLCWFCIWFGLSLSLCLAAKNAMRMAQDDLVGDLALFQPIYTVFHCPSRVSQRSGYAPAKILASDLSAALLLFCFILARNAWGGFHFPCSILEDCFFAAQRLSCYCNDLEPDLGVCQLTFGHKGKRFCGLFHSPSSPWNGKCQNANTS